MRPSIASSPRVSQHPHVAPPGKLSRFPLGWAGSPVGPAAYPGNARLAALCGRSITLRSLRPPRRKDTAAGARYAAEGHGRGRPLRGAVTQVRRLVAPAARQCSHMADERVLSAAARPRLVVQGDSASGPPLPLSRSDPLETGARVSQSGGSPLALLGAARGGEEPVVVFSLGGSMTSDAWVPACTCDVGDPQSDRIRIVRQDRATAGQ